MCAIPGRQKNEISVAQKYGLHLLLYMPYEYLSQLMLKSSRRKIFIHKYYLDYHQTHTRHIHHVVIVHISVLFLVRFIQCQIGRRRHTTYLSFSHSCKAFSHIFITHKSMGGKRKIGRFFETFSLT